MPTSQLYYSTGIRFLSAGLINLTSSLQIFQHSHCLFPLSLDCFCIQSCSSSGSMVELRQHLQVNVWLLMGIFRALRLIVEYPELAQDCRDHGVSWWQNYGKWLWNNSLVVFGCSLQARFLIPSMPFFISYFKEPLLIGTSRRENSGHSCSNGPRGGIAATSVILQGTLLGLQKPQLKDRKADSTFEFTLRIFLFQKKRKFNPKLKENSIKKKM